jgi:hypothetical protein
VLTIPKGAIEFFVGLPALIQHYEHHNKEHGKISFIDFLVLHSTENEHTRTDNHEHDKLPFNKHNHTKSSQTIPFICSNQKIQLNSPLDTSLAVQVQTKQFFVGSDFLKGIWHPPKIS